MDSVEMTGIVKEVLPNTMFTVELENGYSTLGYLSGKMRQNFVKVVLGDRVTIELSPYDLKRGRITRRDR